MRITETTGVSLRSYFSPRHLQAAEHFVAMVVQEEKTEHPNAKIHRIYCLGVITSAVAFVEAAVNELLQDAADNHMVKQWEFNDSDAWERIGSYWKSLGNEARLPLTEKIQATLEQAGVGKLDAGSEPFQSFALAIKLRNALLHYKPVSQSVGGRQHDLAAALASKPFKRNPLVGGGNPEFPDKFLGADGAKWSLRVCKETADGVFDRLGCIPRYKTAHG